MGFLYFYRKPERGFLYLGVCGCKITISCGRENSDKKLWKNLKKLKKGIDISDAKCYNNQAVAESGRRSLKIEQWQNVQTPKNSFEF